MQEERDNSALAVAVFAGVHSHADQSCSPNTSLAFYSSTSIARSGVLFGTGCSLLGHPTTRSPVAKPRAAFRVSFSELYC